MSDSDPEYSLICWNCGGKTIPFVPIMRRFGNDCHYWPYKCDMCGAEKAVEKTEEERGYPE